MGQRGTVHVARFTNGVHSHDLQRELLLIHNALDSLKVDPEVVGVKDLELLDRLEVLDVLRGDLSDLEEPDVTVDVDKGATLDIGLGLVGDLHEVLGLRFLHVLEDVGVDDGSEVVDVRDEEVLDAGGDELVEEARVVEGIEDLGGRNGSSSAVCLIRA